MDSSKPCRDDSPKERRKSYRLRQKEGAALLEAHNVTEIPDDTKNKSSVSPNHHQVPPTAAAAKTWAIPRSVKQRLLQKVNDAEDKDDGNHDHPTNYKLCEEEKESADEDTAWNVCLRCKGVELGSTTDVILTEEDRAACERALGRWKEMKMEIEVRIAMLEMCLKSHGNGGEGKPEGRADPDA